MCVCVVGVTGRCKATVTITDQTCTVHNEVQKLHRVGVVEYIIAKHTEENVIFKLQENNV